MGDLRVNHFWNSIFYWINGVIVMRSLHFLILISLLLNLSSCTNSENKPPLEVLSSHELTITPTEEKPKYEETQDVIFKPNNGFGWYMNVRSNKKEFQIREVLHLPSPGVWSNDDKLIISDDKKDAMVNFTKQNTGFFSHVWGIAEGDPKGDYSIDIYVDNKHIKTFYYHIK